MAVQCWTLDDDGLWPWGPIKTSILSSSLSFFTYLLHFLLHQLVLLDDLLVAALLLLLVLLPLPGVVRVLPDEEDLGHEDEAHGEEAAEKVRHRDEAKGRVLLIT